MRVLSFICFIFFVSFVFGGNIHEKLLDYYNIHAPSEEISFLAILKEKADIATVVKDKTGKESGKIVFDELTKTASRTQVDILTMLQKLNVEHQSYWIVNMVKIQGNYTIMKTISEHESVREVQPNFEYKVNLETPENSFHDFLLSPQTIEWNINYVKAPQVWSQGFRGEDIVVANADTGVQWNHPALIQQYRGYHGNNNVSHDYNWWDSVHTKGSSCGADTKEPCDDNGHGTHTTGTAVGDDHEKNEIGVAPRARWIACRNMNAGLGSPATYLECMQFFLAPTDLNKQNPNPDLRPHVIGNSWGCPTSEGCVPNTFEEAVTNLISAGIFMSVSAGNSGSACSTITDPPAIYSNVMTVAASAYGNSNIASYSSRGPVTVDNSNLPKPDITAPGSSVRSSYPGDRYVSLSGTSMASPHIAGVVALLWQAHPALERDIAATTHILLQSAIAKSATSCATDGISTPQGTTRNNVYGYGELDCSAAVSLALSL